MKITILGLSITSSWGNGHATTFRGLVRELARNGHSVTFLERDVPWYASNRDLPDPPFCKTILYSGLSQLQEEYATHISSADLVIVGSYVPEGVKASGVALRLAKGVTAFYDIDTPVTLAKLAKGDYEYLHPDLISQFDLYLSFTGGPTLARLENEFSSPRARAFYCSVDPDLYYAEEEKISWDLGYLGTYSTDRQPPLDLLMLEAARRSNQYKYVVGGPQYPADINWPVNVERIEHLPPSTHRQFYNRQRFTMNITRADMIRAGYSPSVRLFEAAACGTPIISDYWEGIESIFEPGTEILISHSAEDTLRYLTTIGEEERREIGRRAMSKVLHEHTAAHRAMELVKYYNEVVQQSPKLNNAYSVTSATNTN